MMKSNIKMSHVLALLLLAALLFIATLLSSSLRQTFMYFIMNLLIIALGAEAGLFKAFSSPLEDQYCQDKKATTHVVALAPQASLDCKTTIDETHERKKVKVVEKSRSEKVIGAVKILEIVKKCPSLPSLFFIGGDDEDVHVVAKAAEDEEEDEDLGGGDPSGQELLTKADMFIGNFYKQLKMQRNESRRQIHGF